MSKNKLTAVLAGILMAITATAAWAQPEVVESMGMNEPAPTQALYFELGLSGFYNGVAATEESLAFHFDTRSFSLSALGVMRNDGKYDAELAGTPSGKFFGNYILMQEGGAQLRYDGITFKAGRFRHYDEVDSPYSLFVNSLGHSANMMELRFENSNFLYQSRWVELNARSSFQSGGTEPALQSWHTIMKNGDNTANGASYSGFPDRGANIKTYALKFGNMRVGYQDAAVYSGLPGSGRNFDFEYFLNPIPQYFIQYVKGTGGRPWTTGEDDNNMFGLFWDWRNDEGAYFYAQGLLDDFSVAFIFPQTFDYPYKAGLAGGGRMSTRLGSVGLHAALSPMYSFAPITMLDGSGDYAGNQWRSSYGYTYYPETRYWLETTGEAKSISIEDNMVGFLHGENTVVMMAEWSDSLAGMELLANLEWRLAGSSSPANPWHDGVGHPAGTRLLDEDHIETRVLAKMNATKSYGPLRLYSSLNLGYVWNERKLRAPVGVAPQFSAVDRNVWIWEPVAKANRLLFALSMGFVYRLEPLKGKL
jgi:hypothetical protein